MKNTDKTEPNHILIGIGGTGGKVLKAFRKRLWEEFPKVEDRRKLPIGFVYVDSTDEMMKPDDPTWRVLGQSAQFEESEFVNIKTTDLDMILNNPDAFPGLKNVVKNGEMMRKTLGEVGDAAGQKRRAGRILFASNITKYLSAVNAQYQKVKSISGKDGCCIHIFVGLGGGTGSGSIIDAVAQLRADSLFSNVNETKITVYAMVPELDIPGRCNGGRYHQNGYAALCELSALNICEFLPCDVRTGAEHVKLNHQPLKQFGLLVYSNVNENGTTLVSEDGRPSDELPKLLADFVYFAMFLKVKGSSTEPFIHGLACENFNDHCVEFKTTSKGNDKERARTKAVSSFGIKRIVYPEQRVVEHISYTLSESVFNQMQYNNWKEDLGFTQEPQRKDYDALYIKNEKNMRDWKLNDNFLTLNERILETDKKFAPIQDNWKEQADFYSYDDAKNASSVPINYLEQVMLEKYQNDFRFKQGVEEYYDNKSKDEVLKTMADDIVDAIEKELYTQWYEGQLSLSDLLKVSDSILTYIRNRRSKLSSDIQAADEQIDKFRKEAADNIEYFTHLNVAQKVVGKPKDCYTDHQAILTDLYVEKTYRVAYVFAQKLLGKLQLKFEAFSSQVQEFVAALAKCIEEGNNRIAERNQKQGDLKDMKQAVIEVREDTKVLSFEKELLHNRNTMDKLSSTLRHELVGNKAFAHFGELAKSNMSIERVFEVVDRVMGTSVREIHKVEHSKDKLIGINILQQLQKVLVTDDDIRAFAKDAVEKSGVFILLDDTQLQKSLNNNPNPIERPETMNRKTILVTMPKNEGDDSLKEFALKLEEAFRRAFGNGTPSSTISFDTIGDTMNEITIGAVKNCFPLRALRWLPTYESEYKAMTENSNPLEAKEARILLHSEGDGTCLPPIMGEREMTAQEFIPYFFTAAAMGILNEADDRIEGHGWCLTEVDRWGTPTNTYLSKRFTDLVASENMTSARRERLYEMVEKNLKNPELTMTQRTEYADNVKLLMRDVVGKECSSPNSSKYQQYGNDAEKALELINRR